MGRYRCLIEKEHEGGGRKTLPGAWTAFVAGCWQAGVGGEGEHTEAKRAPSLPRPTSNFYFSPQPFSKSFKQQRRQNKQNPPKYLLKIHVLLYTTHDPLYNKHTLKFHAAAIPDIPAFSSLVRTLHLHPHEAELFFPVNQRQSEGWDLQTCRNK